MITKADVLEFLEAHNGTTAASPLASHFSISIRAAERHLERMERHRLVQRRARKFFVLTDSGRRRLAWYRGELPPGGGTIKFA